MPKSRINPRLPGYDYSRPAWYFVTINVRHSRPVLGSIKAKRMHLSPYGIIALQAWRELATLYWHIRVDTCIIMPDHTHALLQFLPRAEDPATGFSRKPLGRAVAVFKTLSTKEINRANGTPGVRFWHRNYYESIVRGIHGVEAVRRYIRNNPANWKVASRHPQKS